MHLNNLAKNYSVDEQNTSLKYRRATVDDFADLAYVELKCFQTSRLTPEKLADLIHKEDVDFIVAEDFGRVCGYVSVLLRKESSIARIQSLAVLPRFQNKGTGRQLVQKSLAIAEIRGMTHFSVEVDSPDSALVEFYEHLGFEKTDTFLSHQMQNKRNTILRKNLRKQMTPSNESTHVYTLHIPEEFVA